MGHGKTETHAPSQELHKLQLMVAIWEFSLSVIIFSDLSSNSGNRNFTCWWWNFQACQHYVGQAKHVQTSKPCRSPFGFLVEVQPRVSPERFRGQLQQNPLQQNFHVMCLLGPSSGLLNRKLCGSIQESEVLTRSFLSNLKFENQEHSILFNSYISTIIEFQSMKWSYYVKNHVLIGGYWSCF